MTIPMLDRKHLAVLLFVGAAVLGSARVDAAVVSLPDDAQGGSGALVDVPISVSPGEGVLGIDMTITYEAAVLQAQSVTVSGIAATQGFAVIPNLTTPGRIVISEYAMQDPLVGSGEIAKIRFLVTGTPGATSALTFTSASINENGIPAILDNGLFTVSCAGAVNGTACNDGNACTVGDTCGGGICNAGTPITAPPETQNMTVAADKASYSWSAAASATQYDVVRGGTGALPVGPGGGDEVCFGNLAGTTLVDPAVPDPGTGFWYLSRGDNACGIGTYGTRSNGSTRSTTTCP